MVTNPGSPRAPRSSSSFAKTVHARESSCGRSPASRAWRNGSVDPRRLTGAGIMSTIHRSRHPRSTSSPTSASVSGWPACARAVDASQYRCRVRDRVRVSFRSMPAAMGMPGWSVGRNDRSASRHPDRWQVDTLPERGRCDAKHERHAQLPEQGERNGQRARAGRGRRREGRALRMTDPTAPPDTPGHGDDGRTRRSPAGWCSMLLVLRAGAVGPGRRGRFVDWLRAHGRRGRPTVQHACRHRSSRSPTFAPITDTCQLDMPVGVRRTLVLERQCGCLVDRCFATLDKQLRQPLR